MFTLLYYKEYRYHYSAKLLVRLVDVMIHNCLTKLYFGQHFHMKLNNNDKLKSSYLTICTIYSLQLYMLLERLPTSSEV